MDNQTKKIMNQQILGNQSENPYTDLANNQAQQQVQQQQQPLLQQQQQQQQQQPQQPLLQQQQQQQQPINHQAAFEAQMRQQQQQQQDNTYAFDQNGTFCRTGTLENGFIEVDLKSYRDRGVQNRFVAFSIIGVLDESQFEEIRQRNGMASLMMVMESEEQFNRFKQFVAALNWND